MRKKKRILSLVLAVMMVFLVFTEHTPFSFASGGRELTSKMTDSDITIKFSDNSVQMDPKINVIEKEDGSYGPGAAYPNFTIDVDFSKLSANSVAESERLRGGDYVLLEMPNELQLRDGTFADPSNPFELKDPADGVVFAIVKKHLDGGKQYLKVVFNDNVNGRQNVKAKIKFESTVKILSDDPISFDFNIFGKQVTLKINVTRKPIYVGYILKKLVANDYQTDDKQFGIFKFNLLANRKQENMDTVTVRDQLENGSPEHWFEFDSIGFDKNSFEIEVGNFSKDEERVIKNDGIKKYYTTKDGDFSFDNGNIVITFDSTDPEHPKSFEVLIKNPGTLGYKISYGVKVPIDEIGRGFTFNNTASLLDEARNEKLINDKIPGQKHSEEKRTLAFTASGTITSDIKGRISVLKVEDGTSSPVSGAEFSLYKVETGGVETLIETKSTDEKGKINFNQLDVGSNKSNPITYRVKEISAPNDYVQPNPQDVVKEVKLYEKGSGTEENINGAVKVTNLRKTIDIRVNKTWTDNNPNNKEAIFTLKRRLEGQNQSDAAPFTQVGVQTQKTLLATDNSVEFTGLYEYDGAGEKYIYTVEETQVEGYEAVAPVDVGNSHEVTITNTPAVIPKGSIKIIKADEDNPSTTLKGAVFKVTNTAGYDKQFKTEDDGTVVISDLVYGDYTIEETAPPTGYDLNSTSQTVTINSITQKEVIFTNKKTFIPKGKITIIKKDDSGNLLSGVNFSLKNLETNKVIGPKATVDGEVVFDNLDLGPGADGRVEYEVLETTPTAYQTPTVNPKVVLDKTQLEKSINLVNIRKTIDIRVNKTWAGTGATEQNVTFTLKRRVGSDTPAEFTQGNGTTAVEVSKTLTANGDLTDNFVEFTGLHEFDKDGNRYIYTVEETVPAGYHSNAPVEVVGGIANITNTIIPKGTIVITKLEKGTATKIEGAKFSITKDDTQITGSPFTTNSEGEITVSDLKMGTYIITEIEVPDKYKLDGTPTTVELKDEVEKMSAALKIENEKKAGSIKIKKVEAIMKSALQGAEFTITNSAGLTVQKIISAANGVAKAEGLELGKYTITETKAPSGYDADSNTHTVEIKADGDIVKLTVENKVKPAPQTPTPPTPPAGGDSTPPPSDGGGSGTVGKVEKITPKPPKPAEEPKKEEPKKEEPKKEEPNPPADGIGGPLDPPSEPPTGGVGGYEPEPPTDPITGITGGGAGSGSNDTNVLPGMIPGLTGGGTGAGDPNSAVAPGHIGKLPKTGEGLNSSAYALLFAALGMGFVLYGIYRRKKC